MISRDLQPSGRGEEEAAAKTGGRKRLTNWAGNIYSYDNGYERDYMKLQLASCTRLLFSHSCISLLLFPSIDCVEKTVIFVGEELRTQHSGWTNKVPARSRASASPGHEEMQEDPPQELRKDHCPAQPASPPHSSSTRKTKPKRFPILQTQWHLF